MACRTAALKWPHSRHYSPTRYLAVDGVHVGAARQQLPDNLKTVAPCCQAQHGAPRHWVYYVQETWPLREFCAQGVNIACARRTKQALLGRGDAAAHPLRAGQTRLHVSAHGQPAHGRQGSLCQRAARQARQRKAGQRRRATAARWSRATCRAPLPVSNSPCRDETRANSACRLQGGAHPEGPSPSGLRALHVNFSAGDAAGVS